MIPNQSKLHHEMDISQLFNKTFYCIQLAISEVKLDVFQLDMTLLHFNLQLFLSALYCFFQVERTSSSFFSFLLMTSDRKNKKGVLNQC